MAVNSNFNILEPEAWTEVARELKYPMKPMMSQAATSVAGANLEGYVANAFDTVKVPRPVRAELADVEAYNSASDPDINEPNVENAILQIDTHEISAFRINKRDFKFTLIDLVRMYMPTYLDVHARKINAKVKAEARKFEAVFADLSGANATVFDDADLREARRILLGRKFVNAEDGFIAVIDPDAEADLTGLNLFHQADQYGGRDILLNGSMGRAMGFNFFVDNLGSTHTAAGVASAATNGAASEGDTSLTITVGGSTLVEGDAIYFDGAASTDDFYVVDNVDGTTLTLKEPLRKDVATATSIFAVGGTSLKEEFLYNTEAIALVTAGMESIPNTENVGIRRAIGFDPTNNMNYTLSMRPTIHGVDVFIETLYGVKLFYPDYGVRYVKGTTTKGA
jgi:hypothetical protein